MRFVPLSAENAPYVVEAAGCRLYPESRGVIAVDDKGAVCAGAVFDSWSQNSGQVHIAIVNPMVLRRGFLEEAFSYFFVTCKKDLMLGFTPSNNEKSLKFNARLGFRETYRVKDGYARGVDYVLQEMTKSECRYAHHVKKFAA